MRKYKEIQGFILLFLLLLLICFIKLANWYFGIKLRYSDSPLSIDYATLSLSLYLSLTTMKIKRF